MANERMYPMLPCRDLDEAIAFYAALGFARTYRQLRPNPYAVVAREDMQVHLFGMPGFDPEQSYGSVIVVVPDPDALYQLVRGRAAAGLRQAAGGRHPPHPPPAEAVRHGVRLQRRGRGRKLAAGVQDRATRRRRRTGPRPGWRRSSRSPRGSGTPTVTTPRRSRRWRAGCPATPRPPPWTAPGRSSSGPNSRSASASEPSPSRRSPRCWRCRWPTPSAPLIAEELAHTAELVSGTPGTA